MSRLMRGMRCAEGWGCSRNEGLFDICAKGADLDLDLAFLPPFDAAVSWPAEAG